MQVPKLYVLTLMYTLLARSICGSTNKSDDEINNRMNTTDDDSIDQLIEPEHGDDYLFLIISGYRPKHHVLAKHIVSVRMGRPYKFFGDNHMCGGTIISNQRVLTAAHCVINAKGKPHSTHFSVVGGSPLTYEASASIRSYKIAKYVVHPFFSYSTMKGDLAILFSEKKFEMNDLTFQKIPLQDSEPRSGLRCVAMGWGRLFANGPKPDEVLYVDLMVLKRQKCVEYYPMNPSIICASDPDDYEKGVWKGDSGGPLICNGKLTGVVSFGFVTGGPGFFANVNEHYDWITTGSATTLNRKGQIYYSLISIVFVYLL